MDFGFGLQPVSFKLSSTKKKKKKFFSLPFGRKTLRQQPLLTPTVLIGLFHGYIRAMNLNDDDSHSVSDGLISRSHVTLKAVAGSVCTGQGFHHLL